MTIISLLMLKHRNTGNYFDPGHLGDHSLLFSHSYKYLGVHIDSNVSWGVCVKSVCSRIQQQLRLRVLEDILVFYHAVTESIPRYGMATWVGNLTVKLKAEINKLVCSAFKGMGERERPTLQQLLEETVVGQARKITANPSHVLHSQGCFHLINVTGSQLNIQ